MTEDEDVDEAVDSQREKLLAIIERCRRKPSDTRLTPQSSLSEVELACGYWTGWRNHEEQRPV